MISFGKTWRVSVSTVAALMLLGGSVPCTAADAGATSCGNCGTITKIRKVEKEGEGTGLGIVAGGVAGGLLGHQIGGGTGKDIATVAGVAGGAYAGHQVEKKARATTQYEIQVKMDSGETTTLVKSKEPPFAVGDKVKIVSGKLVAR
ncbi:MAG: glycine zipper 2TM domain-containing protein [Sulfuricella sp.]|nr:glycine zipper 2TM domain-containing protein [Sulfuricella sp.]